MELQNRIINALWLSISTLYATKQGGHLFTFYLAVICTFCYAEWNLLSQRKHLKDWRMIGFLIILLFQQSLFYLRQLDVHFVYCLFSIVWATDTGAYIGGKIVSKMRNIWRYPDFISGKKTIFGSLTGLSFGTLAGILFKIPWSYAFVISAVSQIGDLLESRAKRLADVKDSNLEGFEIPGHGGILDRVDALILATPVAYMLFKTQ